MGCSGEAFNRQEKWELVGHFTYKTGEKIFHVFSQGSGQLPHVQDLHEGSE
jgi:hypothetical protein